MRPWQTGPPRWAHWLYHATNSPSTLNTPISVPSQEITRRSPSASSPTRPTTKDFIYRFLQRLPSSPPPSCPSPDLFRGLSRASTPFLPSLGKKGVDGRDKPGHDSEEMFLGLRPGRRSSSGRRGAM